MIFVLPFFVVSCDGMDHLCTIIKTVGKVSNSGKSYIGEFQGRELVVRLKKEDAPYQLPLVWYKGYHAETEDGSAGEINRRGSD